MKKIILIILLISLSGMCSAGTYKISMLGDEFDNYIENIGECIPQTERILKSETYSSVTAIGDLLYKKYVKLSIVRNDVISTFEDKKKLKNIMKLSTLEIKPVYFITRKYSNVKSAEDINNKIIATGYHGGESWIAASNIIRLLGVNAKVFPMGYSEALRALVLKKVDLVILICEDEIINKLKPLFEDKLTLVNINNPKLDKYYYKFNPAKYFNGGFEEYKSQLGVEYFLAGYNFKSRHIRKMYSDLQKCYFKYNNSAFYKSGEYNSWKVFPGK